MSLLKHGCNWGCGGRFWLCLCGSEHAVGGRRATTILLLPAVAMALCVHALFFCVSKREAAEILREMDRWGFGREVEKWER